MTKPRFIPVKDSPGLLRDRKSNGVMNVADEEYLAHLKRKEEAKRKRESAQVEVERINSLENEVSDIKGKLDKILDILTNGTD